MIRGIVIRLTSFIKPVLLLDRFSVIMCTGVLYMHCMLLINCTNYYYYYSYFLLFL